MATNNVGVGGRPAAPVSHETRPGTIDVFGTHLPLAERYAAILAGPGVERGLIGPREVPRLWERHLLNCAVLSEHIPASATVCDLGSGAGLPGIVLAILRPDLRVTLLEPLQRRCIFLTEAVESLALTHVTVLRGRAESVVLERRFEVVAARAVAPLGRLAELATPLLQTGGVLLALKGASAADEVQSARTALRRLGMTEIELLPASATPLGQRTWVVRMRAGTPRRRR